MQSKSLKLLALLAVFILSTSCEAIGDIFQAGMGVGIFLVIAVIVIIIFVIRKLGGGK